MDSQARLTTYRNSLRLLYARDLVGLRRKIAALQEEAEDSVVITQGSLEGEQSSGQLVLEPLEKLDAALAVLAELDPTSVPTPPATATFADFSRGRLET